MTFLCSNCVGDAYVKSLILREGDPGRCYFCNAKLFVMQLDQIVELVHCVLTEHFENISPEPEGFEVHLAREGLWEQSGNPLDQTLQDILGCDEALAQQIKERLSELYDPSGEDAFIDPAIFSGDFHFQERAVDDYELQSDWGTYKDQLAHRSRFFNPDLEAFLGKVLDNVQNLSSPHGPVIASIAKGQVIFRGRSAESIEAAQKILVTAPGSLSAPPKNVSRSGRMNARGVPVFYGGSTEEICVAELRPAVGGYVVLGRFRALRDLRVLDLTRLRRVFLRGSIFDPKHIDAVTRLAFLDKFQKEISKPISPHEEHLEYLPSQYFAEYLAKRDDLRLDGIVFRSSQVANSDIGAHGGNDAGLNNIVLFPNSSGISNLGYSQSYYLESHFSTGDPDDPCPEITIEERPAALDVDDTSREPASENVEPFQSPNDSDRSAPSLELDMAALEVRQVSGVTYNQASIPVRRYPLDDFEVDF